MFAARIVPYECFSIFKKVYEDRGNIFPNFCLGKFPLKNEIFGFSQVIMATNRHDTLDPALLRPGKFYLFIWTNFFKKIRVFVWGGTFLSFLGGGGVQRAFLINVVAKGFFYWTFTVWRPLIFGNFTWGNLLQQQKQNPWFFKADWIEKSSFQCPTDGRSDWFSGLAFFEIWNVSEQKEIFNNKSYQWGKLMLWRHRMMSLFLQYGHLTSQSWNFKI